MSERGLVVHFDRIDTMVAALQGTHDRLQSLVSSTLGQVNAEISGWAADTDSRAAQTAYQQKLQRDSDALVAALDDVRSALADLRGSAHTTEVKNVAVMD